MAKRGLQAELVLLEGAPHICDLSSDPESDVWKAILKAYEFNASYVS
jgi:hypothetical protein